MSFIQREIDRLAGEILAQRNAPALGERYDELYAARQALAWALEPGGFKSPYDMIMGTQEETEGCLVALHPPQSSSICAPTD